MKKLRATNAFLTFISVYLLASCASKPVDTISELNPKLVSRNGVTQLMTASFRGETAVMQELLKMGAEVNQADFEGQTALHQAIIGSSPEAVAVLLEHKANVNAVDAAGFTPLIYAASRSSLIILDYLLVAKADPKVKDPRGWTALFFATSKGNPKMVERLLKVDSSGVNDPALDQTRPLELAVEDKNLPLAEALLGAGADPLLGKPGERAIDIAANEKLSEMTRILCLNIREQRQMGKIARICRPR